MTVDTAVFICSICGEKSSDICVYCTKDSCVNHRCLRCKRCSDCCECEEPLSAAAVEPVVTEVVAPEADPFGHGSASETVPQPQDGDAAAPVHPFSEPLAEPRPEEAVQPAETNPGDDIIP
jgi:hypothetical protein